MRKWVALALGVLVPLLGLAGVGSAQSTVQVQGTIQAVDCQQGTVVVATPDNTNTIAVAPYTAVLVDSQAVSLCDLQQYVGSQATILLVPSGNEFIATRINATAQGAVAPVALPVQQEAVAPLPIAGVVLGTIALAGLIYLLVRDGEGHYWRYPYYGEYYRYYYRPEYRPYAGPYPAVWPVLYAAAPIGGIVLGVTIFNGLDYLMVRDRDGRYERYPYYGPYRSYYRPEYRAYAGPYRGDAPVHYGDTRGSAAFHRTNGGPAPYQRPQQYQQPQRQQQYNYQRPQQYQQPYQRPQQYQQPQRQQQYNYQRPQQYQQPYQRPQQYQQPQRQQQYNYQRPQQYQQPYQRPQQYQQPQRQYQQYQRPNYTPAGNGNGGGSRGRDSRQTCQSNAQGQQCSDGTHNR